jgi:hypothetical protein
MPRESPEGGETVDGIYLPEGTEVFTSSWYVVSYTSRIPQIDVNQVCYA